MTEDEMHERDVTERSEDRADTDEAITRVVYGTCQADGVLRFVPRAAATEIAQVYEALGSRDWGEFRRALPPGRWEDVVEWHEDDLPADDVLLSDVVPMNADEGYWPGAVILDDAWLPDAALEIGRFVPTALDGAVFGCPEEREAEIVLAFLHEGFEIAREDGLVEIACGLSNDV